MDLVQRLASIEKIVESHSSLIEVESKTLLSEHSISSSHKTAEELQKMEDDNRLLQIGIVGRVKAGKSSLINALLFDGKSILPKAATPMTAALTMISYGDELSAEIEFFKQQDIDNIKKAYDQYLEEHKVIADREYKKKIQKIEDKKKTEDQSLRDRLNNTKIAQAVNNTEAGQKFAESSLSEKEKMELRAKAENIATREMNKNEQLSASYDQYMRIKESGVNPDAMKESATLSFDRIEILADGLSEYVGSNGKYMPFTKSVHIKIPNENLINIQIIDTPGVNDPVTSREERTRELLKSCDVVFIVSPSGQFMTNEDLELMDRITTKNGIRELFVIASKCDTQLYGSERESNNGDLHKALDSIRSTLASHLHKTLTELKKTNPEVGTVYDRLIMESEQSIIHSSGVCLTLKEQFDAPENLDSHEKHTWELLLEAYPDYFSQSDKKLSLSNLDILANINVIQDTISSVRGLKDQILSTRKEEYINAKINAFEQYRKDLINHIDFQVSEINNSDIDELKNKIKKLNYIKNTVHTIVDEEYFDLVEELNIELNDRLDKQLKKYFKETKKDINDAKGSEQRSRKVGGIFGFLQNTEYYSIKTIRTGAVKSALTDLTIEIENSIETESSSFILGWRKSLTKELVSVLRENVDDDGLNPSQIRKVIRTVINGVKFPELSYDNEGGCSELAVEIGTLEDSAAERFIDDADKCVNSLKKRVSRDIKEYMSELMNVLKSFSIASEIFNEQERQLEELERQIENKNVILDEYARIKRAMDSL